MRPFPLSELKAGITRSRIKGGANKQALYDLLNAYVNEAGTPVSRDGSVIDAMLPVGTKGLMSYLGTKMVFATSDLEMGGTDYVLQILKHPESETAQLVKIHYAKTFMRYPYVVAEFDDGSIHHFWLQEAAVWNADTVYMEGTVVLPVTPTGFAYIAGRSKAAAPLWTAGTVHAIGDKVEPTVPNGYYAQVISVQGALPASGTVEPDWPADEGASVIEESDASPVVAINGGGTGSNTIDPTTIPSAVQDRYLRGDVTDISQRGPAL